MFKRKQDLPKVYSFAPFLGLIYPWETETLPKTKIFPETTSLWLSINPSPRSQINHRILIKLIKKNVFGGGSQNGLFKVKNRPVNKDQEVRGQVSTTFSEVPNSGLTIYENIFIVARLKLVLFEFQCHFFYFHTPFFDFGLVFITFTLHAKFPKKICMPTKLLLVENCSKMGAHLPEPTTWTTFGNYIYTTIVCNDTPLSQTRSNFKSCSS